MAKSKLVHKGQTVQVETSETPPRPRNHLYIASKAASTKVAKKNIASAAQADRAHQAQKDVATVAGVRKAARMNSPRKG